MIHRLYEMVKDTLKLEFWLNKQASPVLDHGGEMGAVFTAFIDAPVMDTVLFMSVICSCT